MADFAGPVPFRLGEFDHEAGRFTGLVLGEDQVFDLRLMFERSGRPVPSPFTSLQDLLGDWDRSFEAVLAVAEFARDRADPNWARPLNELVPRPPIARPGRMLYAAANYRDHVAGMQKTFVSGLPPAKAATADLRPYLFAKACAQTGATADIVLPRGLSRVDWEAELAVVIGRPAKRVAPEQVADHIAGYMTTNDVSCRDLTWRDDRPAIRSDWLAGKSFDSFAPMGPFFTPRQFVPDHAALFVRCWVNGVAKQDGVTRNMIFGIEDQVAYGSAMMTLEPGDVVSTGTPAGTGQERLEFLKAGDVVETEVELCGRQRNAVVADPAEEGEDRV